MIKFFRKIRQRLLIENKFSKYLLYAIGEIALVMIGILMALQVNNWNTEKILVEKEKKHLLEIDRDLEKNVENFEQLKDQEIIIMGKIDFLLKAIKEKRPYTPDFSLNLRSVKGIEEIKIINSGFRTASSFGLDNIRTDSLRSEIVLLFDQKYPNEKGLFQALGRMHHESLVIPVMLKYFTNGEGSRPIPNNYQQLLESNEFMSMLGTRQNLKLALKNRLERLIKDSNTLRLHIQEELKRFK